MTNRQLHRAVCQEVPCLSARSYAPHPAERSQALLRWEGESREGRGSPLAGQGLHVVPLEVTLSSPGSESTGSSRQETC